MAHLTQEQRYEIAALRKQDFSITKISERIGKDKSVVSRELRRNCDGRNGLYKAALAHKKALKRLIEKPKYLHFTTSISCYVEGLLRQDYSPEQIVGTAKRHQIACVSHERIYQWIWADKKAGGSLYQHLRSKGKLYRKRGAAKDKRGQLVGRVSIEHRPSEVEQKNRIGDLEMDLIIGQDHKGALLTINDRATGLLRMAKIESKEAVVVEVKVIELLQDWPCYLHTITTDNGKEFARHQQIAEQLQIAYFFAHPYHSWERGANENLNGLVRQYFPKQTSFENLAPQYVTQIQEKLNQRPRKRLGYLSPQEVFEEALKKGGSVAFVP